jgi:nicotinate-nucleotide adenylyltransferase
MKVTVFGAAFDPPHLGHEQIAQALLDHGMANEVWLLPVKIHSFGKHMSSDRHRLAMLETLVKPGIKIETHELEQAGESITYQTLLALQKLYPEHEFSFVIGADNLARFHEWDDYLQMIKEFTFYVYPRQGYKLEPLYPDMKVLNELEQVDISSTQVKDRLSQGKSIANLVNLQVVEYISHHKLYCQ